MQIHLFFFLRRYIPNINSQLNLIIAHIKAQIELNAIIAPPGILPPGTKFESYIGHNVINISKIDLNEHQLSALEKGLTFCPTPKGADKSEIWNDFKEFHRRLELAQ